MQKKTGFPDPILQGSVPECDSYMSDRQLGAISVPQRPTTKVAGISGQGGAGMLAQNTG